MSGELGRRKWLLKNCHRFGLVRLEKAWQFEMSSHEDNLTQGECRAEFLGNSVASDVWEAHIDEKQAYPTADLSTDAHCGVAVARLKDVVAAV